MNGQEGDRANLRESHKKKFSGRMRCVNSVVGMMYDWSNIEEQSGLG